MTGGPVAATTGADRRMSDVVSPRREVPESPVDVRTDSSIPVRTVYTESDVAPGLPGRLGLPGEPPFTRGPYATMYRGQLWTMRQFAGYGSSEETNERFRFLLRHGQTALSVAFDLPTQLGYDSDHELARPEIGKVGVAIDSAGDMAAVFDGLPLEKVSVNFTINATAPVILAMYLVAAERQGVPWNQLAGTLQNDILKEFLARNLFVYPPGPSMRLSADVIEFAAHRLPRFNPISVTGYHAREAGCDAVQELGLTMANAIAYGQEVVRRGLDFDDFAPRLSFHFATTLDLFEEVAKLRAARRMWHRIATDRFGARRPESGRLRFFSGSSGATLTAQQPYNNVVRSTLQCLGAVLGGAQSIHVMGYDEAYELPSEEAVTLALRTQQIIAYESGVTRTVDPLAGSYYVERLTDEVERRAEEVVAAVEELGGAVAALEAGAPQRWIAQSAYEYEVEISSGARPKVGVNCFAGSGDARLPEGRFELDPGIGERQLERLRLHRERRDAAAVDRALGHLAAEVEAGRNVMEPLIDAARAGATIGEMSDVMRAMFGEFKESEVW